MNHDTYLSGVVDEIFTKAGKEQHALACRTTQRYFVEDSESIVGMERFGLVDFTLRLIRYMRLVHDVKWTPVHPKFAINDFSCMVNRLGLIKELQEAAGIVQLTQLPYKRCAMINTIAGKWAIFERRLGKEMPPHKRYFRFSLTAMYADYLGRQLGSREHYDHILTGVNAGKTSFLPSVGRHVRATALSTYMANAEDVTMRKFEEAAARFKAYNG